MSNKQHKSEELLQAMGKIVAQVRVKASPYIEGEAVRISSKEAKDIFSHYGDLGSVSMELIDNEPFMALTAIFLSVVYSKERIHEVGPTCSANTLFVLFCGIWAEGYYEGQKGGDS